MLGRSIDDLCFVNKTLDNLCNLCYDSCTMRNKENTASIPTNNASQRREQKLRVRGSHRHVSKHYFWCGTGVQGRAFGRLRRSTDRSDAVRETTMNKQAA